MARVSAHRRLLLVCLTSGGWAFSFGVGTQIVTHWLHSHGQTNFAIGLNNSAYYLGIAIASLFVPWLTYRFGTTCAATAMASSGVLLAIFPFGTGNLWWFGLRFLIGVAGAVSLIPLEAVVSRYSDAGCRAKNFGFYAVALTLGGAIGISTGLYCYEFIPQLAFLLGGIVPVLSGVLVWRALADFNLPIDQVCQAPISWSRNSLSYSAAWSQGFLEGGLITFLSLYLVSLGMSKDMAGVQIGVTMVGVVLFQVPVGWLADRFGRTRILLLAYGMVVIGLAVLPMLELSWALPVCLFLFGAWCGAMYPVGLALLGEHTPTASLPRAYARYLAIECFGSQMGAAAMGKARDWWGEASMFLVGLAAVGAALCACLLVLVTKRLRGSSAPTDLKVAPDRRAA